MPCSGREVTLPGGGLRTEPGLGTGGPTNSFGSLLQSTDSRVPLTFVLTAWQTKGANFDLVLFQMKTGLIMNVIGITCVFLAINTWGRVVFDLDQFPDWANVTAH